MRCRALLGGVGIGVFVSCVKTVGDVGGEESGRRDSSAMDTAAPVDSALDDTSPPEDTTGADTDTSWTDSDSIDYKYKGDLDGVWEIYFIADQYPYSCECDYPMDVVVDEGADPQVSGSCTCDWMHNLGKSTFDFVGSVDAADTGGTARGCITVSGDPLRGDWVEATFEVSFNLVNGQVQSACHYPCAGHKLPVDFGCIFSGWWNRPLDTDG